MRFFVVRCGSFSVKTLTDLAQGVVTKGRVRMNFKPNRRVGARLQFRIENPGIYLIRLETLNTDSDRRGSELTLILAARFRA